VEGSEVRTRSESGPGASRTHGEVVAEAAGDLGQRVGRAGRDEDDVGPSSKLAKRSMSCQRDGRSGRRRQPHCVHAREMVAAAAPEVVCVSTHLDVKDRVANLLPALRSSSGLRQIHHGGHRSGGRRATTDLPLVRVAPDVGRLAAPAASILDLGRVVEGQAWLGRDDLQLDVGVLLSARRCHVSAIEGVRAARARVQLVGSDGGRTSSRASAMSGALTEATLPVVSRRTWTAPGTRAEAATNCLGAAATAADTVEEAVAVGMMRCGRYRAALALTRPR
jgi:hypothetical protein